LVFSQGVYGGHSASWHAEYKSAYIFVGGLNDSLTEGDLIVVFSQFGEVVDCNLCRDKKTGKPLGFAFIAYEDQRSTILAVDDMNGSSLLGRTIRVDHSEKYRRPKKKDKVEGEELEGGNPEDSEDEDYDERRKRIWDYEKYAPVEVRSAARPSAGNSEGGIAVVGDGGATRELSADDKRAKKIMAMLEKRKRARAHQTKDGIGEGKANVWAADRAAGDAPDEARAPYQRRGAVGESSRGDEDEPVAFKKRRRRDDEGDNGKKKKHKKHHKEKKHHKKHDRERSRSRSRDRRR
jgi:RNA-binding motif X-linked protein 2